MAETVVNALDGIYSWPGPRAGMSLIGARLGRLLLTSERLLFLSTGSSGLARDFGVALTAGPAWLPVLGGMTTDELDLGALENDGSMSVHLQLIQDARVKRRWDLSSYLVVESVSDAGKRNTTSFMSRYGFNRKALLSFLDALDRGRREGTQTELSCD